MPGVRADPQAGALAAGAAVSTRPRFRFFELTCAPSSPTPINSARASAPSIRRPRRPTALPGPQSPRLPPFGLCLRPIQHPKVLFFWPSQVPKILDFMAPVTAGAKGPPCRSLTTGRADGAHRDRVDQVQLRGVAGPTNGGHAARGLGQPLICKKNGLWGKYEVGIFGKQRNQKKARVRKKATWVNSRSKVPFRFSFRCVNSYTF